MVSTRLSDQAALLEVRNRAGAAISDGETLSIVLRDMILAVEGLGDRTMSASVLLLDETGRYLRHGAAPSLPDEYNAKVDGIEIGPAAGSCGTAVFYKEAVFVADVRQDPIWAGFADDAARHGLRACWSAPVLDGEGRALGAFAIYCSQARLPRPPEVAAIAYVADVAAEVITRSRSIPKA